MFTEHDRFILNENKFTVFPAEEDGYSWAITSQPLLNTLVMIIDTNNYFVMMCCVNRGIHNTISKKSYTKSIEEVIIKSTQMRNEIESDWIARGLRPRG